MIDPSNRQPIQHEFSATGFHARCWDAVVAALPDDMHVYAVDMRGHGRSEKRGPYRWDSFAEDVSELLTYLQCRDAIGVGHSMGGHCLTQVCATHPGMFQRLLLVDPVILPPEAYTHQRYSALGGPEDHPVAKRKGHWTGWEEMFERFADRKPFSLWQRQVLEDYCRYGVLPAAEGEGFDLACPGIVEASIYLNNTTTDVHAQLKEVKIPVVILRAKMRDPNDHNIMDFSMSPTWSELAAHFPDARDVYLPHLTHFIPMQAPELVAEFIVNQDAQVAGLPADGEAG